MAMLREDLFAAVRQVRRRPAFATAIVVTLAAAIGTATTAFGLATSVLWRPLPFKEPTRLVFVWESVQPREGQPRPARVTGARYAAWRDLSKSLSSVALFGAASFQIDDPSGARSIGGVRVSASYFDTLGVQAALGRTFVAADEQPGQNAVVILSHGVWLEQFGGRADAIGETWRLSGRPYVVVGVMPPVVFPAWPQNPAVVTLDPDSRAFWVPIARTPALDQASNSHVYGVIGRLTDGVTLAQAQGDLARTAASSADRHGTQLSPLREQFVSDARTSLVALTGASLAVLLIACANLAALYISAFERRRVEFATRAAIGAGASRLVRQLMVEGLLLSLSGGAIGVLMAQGAMTLLPRWLPTSIPLLTPPTMDLQVAGFGAGLAVITGLILTAWPVARLAFQAPAPRGIATAPRGLVYRLLVVAQIAVTLALTVCAGLLGQSLSSVQAQDLGFAVDRRLVVDVSLPALGPSDPRPIVTIEQAVLDAVATAPGITAVAAAYDHPLEANWTDAVRLIGDVSTPDHTRSAELRIVSPSYFDALDVAIVEGRALTARDDLDAPGAVVVNEAFARETGGPVLGRQMMSNAARGAFRDAAPNRFEIVGIVQDERTRGPERPASAAVYIGTRQFPQSSFSLIARTTGEPLSSVTAVRAAIRGFNPAISVDRPVALDAVLADQLAERRVTAEVISSFALSALALAAVGMYGLLAVMVSSRTREIGMRLALGASPRLMARSVIRNCAVTVGLGVVAGVALAFAAGRLIESLLIGVKGNDPMTLGVVVVSLMALQLVAAAAPARRAARIDPIVALRAD